MISCNDGNTELELHIVGNDACISPDLRLCFFTDYFHIFNCRVNSTSRSISKRHLNKIYLKKGKFLLLTGEIVEMYISQSENSKGKKIAPLRFISYSFLR